MLCARIEQIEILRIIRFSLLSLRWKITTTVPIEKHRNVPSSDEEEHIKKSAKRYYNSYADTPYEGWCIHFS
jgi:hypothetical protein